jgi:hypothetical protein
MDGKYSSGSFLSIKRLSYRDLEKFGTLLTVYIIVRTVYGTLLVHGVENITVEKN